MRNEISRVWGIIKKSLAKIFQAYFCQIGKEKGFYREQHSPGVYVKISTGMFFVFYLT